MQEHARKYSMISVIATLHCFSHYSNVNLDILISLYAIKLLSLSDAPLDLPTMKLMMPNSAASASNQQVANMVNAHTWTPVTSTLLSSPEHASVSQATLDLYAINFNASK